jgi:hypothetical protein
MNKIQWEICEKKVLEGIEINKKNRQSAEDGIEEGETVLVAIRAKLQTFK